MMTDPANEPNEIIRFLIGAWKTNDVMVSVNKEVQTKSYTEAMKIKNQDSVTITAYGYDNGKNLTRDMTIEMGDQVTLRQGNFFASGHMHANAVTLRGAQDGRQYEFRLYFMEDKFIFQRDVLEKGKIVEAQMSYLERLSKS